MTRILTASLLSSGGLLFSTRGVAHPGTDHGMPFREGMAHLLTQPDHLLMILGAGLFAAIMLKSLLARRATARKHRDK
ncbi:MAG: HupE/UreJ family protein [Thiohalophilus sp.]|uniref:HupE/UreJ family protein n=1 Tax=Thiohalophilus sp. TaxID=3028392 RepID=UPI00286FF73B|nr:HupE/UreJ family protein [Thiohalophilus sp.]MDR9435799.1 HupE/UreJ family protein [Thiohalophilus sp.]